MTIQEWADKGFLIAIFPVVHNTRKEWSSGVMIGSDDKITWLKDKDEGCRFSSFINYDNALNAALNFCENYKPKRK